MTTPPVRFRVLDDFLEEEAWTEVWTHLQFEELHPVTRTSGAWKLEDGVPFGGQEIVAPNPDAEPKKEQPGSTEGAALRGVLEALLAAPQTWKDIVGDDWQTVTARSYVYPRGSALSWHSDDTERFAGAFVYYASPRWNAHWGGELLLADGDPEQMLSLIHI